MWKTEKNTCKNIKKKKEEAEKGEIRMSRRGEG